eukprot:2257811-Rhodomonas_salina.1
MCRRIGQLTWDCHAHGGEVGAQVRVQWGIRAPPLVVPQPRPQPRRRLLIDHNAPISPRADRNAECDCACSTAADDA